MMKSKAQERKLFLDDCKHVIRVVEGLFEVCVFTLLYYSIWARCYRNTYMPAYYGEGKLVLTGIYTALVLVIMYLCEGFKYGHYKFTDVAVSQCISLFIVNFITYFQLSLISNCLINCLPMIVVFAGEVLLSLICVYWFTRLYHTFYVPHDILLIYGSEEALDIKFKMDQREDKYTITEVISVFRNRDEVLEAIQRHDAVLINDIAGVKRNDILKYCYEHSVRTYVVPKVSDLILGGAQDINLFDTPLKLVKGRGLSLPQRFVKRTMDIVLCLIALIPGVPLMLMVALAIKLEDHGPVFYRQKRVTRDGRVFEILKFRSMIVDAEKGGYDLSMRANGKDPRITKVGSVIRAARLDELPQILNILKGDMSIVGPRPERVENVEAYAKEIPEWHLREKVKGGLTGYAQIFGRYNTSPLDKMKLDIMYIENYSLFLDIKLIFLTVRILFSKESTEGFDAVEERDIMRKQLIKDLEHELQAENTVWENEKDETACKQRMDELVNL